MVEMGLDGFFADKDPLADLFVGQSFSHQLENFHFSFSQILDEIICRSGRIAIFDRLLACVQFFLNETKLKYEVSRFWLWDSRFENPVVDLEKQPPYWPQD